MTATLVGNSPFQDIPLGTIFDSMAAGATVESGVLVIPVLTNSSGYPLGGLLILEGAGLVTTGASQGWFQAVLLPVTPGGIYQEYGVSNAQLFPLARQGQFSPAPSTALTVIPVEFAEILPSPSQKLVGYNNLGNALAASVAATLRVFGGSIG